MPVMSVLHLSLLSCLASFGSSTSKQSNGYQQYPYYPYVANPYYSLPYQYPYVYPQGQQAGAQYPGYPQYAQNPYYPPQNQQQNPQQASGPSHEKSNAPPPDTPQIGGGRTNVLFILLDDLGWSDISAQGGQFATPNIDELYHNSIRMQRHYIHLMCSPSRTQYLTGRYAMYQGINKMTPWDYTEIGGVPIGQPTLAQWMKEYGEYRTYGIGKWHLGYAYEGLMPLQRGFDEWYGFLQGAVNYATKLYDDIKFGPTEFYDFWYNNEIEYSAANADTNAMYQYGARFQEMMEEHVTKHKNQPFFVYAPLQAIHGPLRRVDEYMDVCIDILGENASKERSRYCENTFLMDKIIGDMMTVIHKHGLWDDTLIVFGTDNGANLDNEGCNYPLRGTKGTLFEGNIRTIAFVTGGVITNNEQVFDRQHPENNVRQSLFSNLDWTPTILEFTGLLHGIQKQDHTWDGVSQYEMITQGDEHKKRDHIVFNVGLSNLDSCSLVFEHNDRLYKYITSSEESIDRWSWYRVNGWCEYDEDRNVQMVEEGAEDDMETMEYFYDLTEDEREQNNMIAAIKSSKQSKRLIDIAMNHVKPYTKHPLYSEKLDCLWYRVPNGDPSLLEDGKSVRPWLTKPAYLQHLTNCFDQEESNGKYHPKKKKDLYFKEWRKPKYSWNRAETQQKKRPPHRSSLPAYGHWFALSLLVLLFSVLALIRWMYPSSKYGSCFRLTSAEEIRPLLS